MHGTASEAGAILRIQRGCKGRDSESKHDEGQQMQHMRLLYGTCQQVRETSAWVLTRTQANAVHVPQ